ncbi:hypothetical protein FEM48_Zijuj03G0065100 [Ziziphus jujuba var. spinosa]|uniref:Subtilisin-like protease fibronectin type-III domain-containing protein n=1 Tax=Ziziphus jujuba var. spinosa TaxID=714518 RepID=A0A978VNQ8_ZIZJJ|nr:hypothetical protein FEM48_Zijuj03G0065100 [Ziziphus jujuba var. spinosa]
MKLWIQVYVVYMGDMPKEEVSTSPLHLSMLEKVISSECDINSLDEKLVKGKIVYCDSNSDGEGPLLAGAAGFLGKGRLFGDTSFNLPLPGSSLSYNEAGEVYKYIRSNSNPIATISRSKEVTDARSPYIPNYSSRAKRLSSKINPDAEFAYGSGLINPIKAPYPGLVYDTDELDYVKFLCGAGYTNDDILQYITGTNKVKCSKGNSISATNLNYPSFALSTSTSESITHVFHRTVTNVGSAHSKYKAKVVAPKGLNVIVSPSVLSFTSIGQKLSFTVTLKGKIDGVIASTSLLWDDGTFQVRRPIIVYIAP